MTSLIVSTVGVTVSIIALCISLWIANQQRELQERQLRKDLFDRRFDIYTKTREFMTYVAREDGKIALTGPEYREFQETMERAEMLCERVYPYLTEVEKTVRDLYVYRQKEGQALAASDTALIKQGADLQYRVYVTLWQRRKDEFRQYLSLEKRSHW